MDEDGYLEAELLDGRRGLVPSNYITKLVGEDLMEFHQSMVVGTSGGGAGAAGGGGGASGRAGGGGGGGLASRLRPQVPMYAL